jgi:hypothetical protein
MSRVTPLPAPLSSTKLSPRKRARPERMVPTVEQQQVNKAAPPQTLLEVLADGQRRGKKRGWLRTTYGGKGSGQFSDGERAQFPPSEVAIWEMHARAAVARQPEIHNTIIEIMAGDPTLSWDQIASTSATGAQGLPSASGCVKRWKEGKDTAATPRESSHC